MTDTTSEQPRPRRRWGRWVALALVGLIALGILGHAFWGWWEERELEREFAELRVAGEPMVGEDFKHALVSDAENAVPLLRRAADSIDEQNEAWAKVQQMEVEDLIKEENLELVRGVVERNAVALRMVGEARGKKGVNWQIQLGQPMVSTPLPDLGKQKRLAQLVHMAALLAHEQGDDREAMARIGDLLMLSRAMEKMDLGAMPNLVSYFISSMAAGAVIEIVPELRIGAGKGEVAEGEVRVVIRELLDEEGTKQLAVRAVKFERAMGVEWITTKEALWGGSRPSDQLQSAGLALRRYVMRPAVFGDGRFLLRYAKANQEAMEASGNWPGFRRAAEGPKAMLRNLEAWPTWHGMGRMMAANYERMMLQQYRASTLRRLAWVGLGVRLYQVEHGGELPSALEDLVPVYLHDVPGDPMKEKGTISFGRERGILWSVGDNGSDEGGNEQINGGERRWGREDVVAHLKRQEK